MTDDARESNAQEVDWEDSPSIALEDDDGVVSHFEMLAILEIDDAGYAVLTPADEPADPDAPLEIQILHYDESDDGTFSLRSVEDETLSEHLFEVVTETLRAAAEE
jgi:uncharacterized protein YrzB (UPF0473 family)